MATEVASLFALLFLKDSMTPGLRQADNSLDTFSGKLTATGKKLQGMGTKMTLWTAPLAIGLTKAVGMATDFEESMANVGAILGDNADDMEELSDAILEMGANSVAGPQAVADSFFDVVSGISDATTHLDITQASINTAEAGQADLGATTSAMIGVMNAFGFSAAQAGTASDIMTATVGAGVLTMDELAAALPNVTTLSAELGIGFDEISGSLALLTKGGTSASVASTQLRAAMTSLIKPNKDMQSALAELGFESGQAAIDALGLQGALDALDDTTVAADVGMAALLGSTEALGAALGLTGDEAKDWLDNFRGIPTEAQQAEADFRVLTREAENVAEAFQQMGVGFDGATGKAQAIQNASPAAQFALLASNAKAVGIQIGQALLPALAELSEDLIPIIKDIANWIGENPTLTKQILGLALAAVLLGPVLGVIGTALTVIGGATAAGQTIGLLLKAIQGTTAFTTLSTAMSGIAASIATAAGPFVAFGIVLAGIIWLADQIAKKLGFEGIGDLLQQSLDIWTNNFDMAMIIAKEFVTLAANWLQDRFNDAINAVIRAINGLIFGFNELSSVVGGPTITAIKELSREIDAIPPVPEEVLSSMREFLRLSNASSGIRTFLEPFIGGGGNGNGGGGGGGGLSIPQNALGGDVFAGMPSIVGEKGPELFIPNGHGTIIPNNVAFGGDRALAAPAGNGNNGRQFNVKGDINVYGVQNVPMLLDRLEREADLRAKPA